MGFVEGRCFKCSKKLNVGVVCESCARIEDDEEYKYFEAERQENFQN